MSRKKAGTTLSKQSAKKVSKRAAKTSSTPVSAQSEDALVMVDSAHETLAPAAQEETLEAAAVVEATHPTQAQAAPVETGHETTQSELVQHDPLPAHDDVADVKSGVLASIMAFKQSNETQFYGIVALAVFVLILIL